MEGYAKNEICNRNGCKGVIEEKDIDGGCSCHINPPCGYCTTLKEYCPECDWDAEEEQDEKEAEYSKTDEYKKHVEKYRKEREERDAYMDDFYKKYRGEIPPKELQIIHKSNTHFSMKKLGVYPEGKYTIEEIRKKVRGTFGGRFTHFGNYSFEYIAYTD